MPRRTITFKDPERTRYNTDGTRVRQSTNDDQNLYLRYKTISQKNRDESVSLSLYPSIYDHQTK